MKALSAWPIDCPFDSMTPASTAEAADGFELELFEDTVSDVVAPEPGPVGQIEHSSEAR